MINDASNSFDIRTIDRDQVIDIREYEVNCKQSKYDRINTFVKHLTNPYFYRCGEVIVELEFASTDRKLEDLLTEFLIQKK